MPGAPPPIRDDGVHLLLNETLSPLFPNSLIWTGKIHNSWMTDRTKNVDDSPIHTKANQRSVDRCPTQQLTTPGAPPPVRDDDGVRLLSNETLSPLFPNSSIWTGKIHNSWMTDRTKFVDDSPMQTRVNQRSVDRCPTIN